VALRVLTIDVVFARMERDKPHLHQPIQGFSHRTDERLFRAGRPDLFGPVRGVRD